MEQKESSIPEDRNKLGNRLEQVSQEEMDQKCALKIGLKHNILEEDEKIIASTAGFGKYPENGDPMTCMMCDVQTDCMRISGKL